MAIISAETKSSEALASGNNKGLNTNLYNQWETFLCLVEDNHALIIKAEQFRVYLHQFPAMFSRICTYMTKKAFFAKTSLGVFLSCGCTEMSSEGKGNTTRADKGTIQRLSLSAIRGYKRFITCKLEIMISLSVAWL